MADAIVANIPARSLAFILSSNTIGSIAGYVGLVNHRIVPLLLDAQINEEFLQTAGILENWNLLSADLDEAALRSYAGLPLTLHRQKQADPAS